MSAIGAVGCSVSGWNTCSQTSWTGANNTACTTELRDQLDLSAAALLAAQGEDESLASILVATIDLESLLDSEGIDGTEETSVTESQPLASPMSLMSAASNFSTLSTAELGSVELVTEKRNDVAAKLRELLDGNAFNAAGAKFTITYNYQDGTVTVGGNISTTARNTLQAAIDSDTAGVASLMQELRDSLGLDTPNGITKRNFTLAMTSLADLDPSNDLSYNVNVKITPNTASIPPGGTVPTVVYNIQVGGTLPTFNASSYLNLATDGNTPPATASAVTATAYSLLADNSGIKHDWTLTKFLLTSDGKIRGTMTVTGSSVYAFDSLTTTPPPTPTDPPDDGEDTEVEEPGAGSVTIDPFVQTIMDRLGVGQGDVLEWLYSIPWYDAALTGSVQTGLSSTFRAELADWWTGADNSLVDTFLQNNGLQNVMKPLQ